MIILSNYDRQSVSFLNVPITERDEASKLGALWDKVYRKWYVPLHLDINKFSKWFGKTPDFNLYRSSLNNPKLFIDLVPRTSWSHNLSQQLSKSDWNKIRKLVYEKSNNVCEVCGCVGTNGRIDAHERWHYDEGSKIQTLVKISSLCPNCHMSSHMGFARVQKKEHIAMAHLAWINLWSEEECEQHSYHSFQTWARRSQYAWKTDVSLLFEYGISLSPKSMEILIQENGKWFIDTNKIKMKKYN